MHQIHDSLLPLAVSIDSLTPDPDNARRHTDRNLDSIAASLRAYGQRKPIVVQKQGMVVRAGNGTLDAAKRLGWSEVAAIIVDEGDISATAYALADNRTAELAEWDEPQLAKLLGRISSEDDYDPQTMGFEEAEVVKLLAKFGQLEDSTPWVPPTFDQPSSGGGAQPSSGGGAQPASDTPDLPVSHVRMVQLFLNADTHPQFLERVRALASDYGTNNVTDTVMRALEEAVSNRAAKVAAV